MSRLYVLLVNGVAVAMTIGVVITSERVNRDQIERPIMMRVGDIASPRNQDVIPLADSSLFFLHLLKKKPQYQKLDKIEPTTVAPPVTVDCICVPFYLCDSNRTIITDGSGIIDVR